MGKVKKSEKAAPAAEKKEKKEKKEDSGDEKTVEKRHRRRTAGKSKFRTPIKRLCKSLAIPQVNKDASYVLDDAVQKFLIGLTRHMASMLANSHKTLTQRTARLAYISYMESLGANDDISRGALKRGDTALKHLEDSFGEKKKEKKPRAQKKTK